MTDFSTEQEKDVRQWAKKAADILFCAELITDFYYTKFSNFEAHDKLNQLWTEAIQLGIVEEEEEGR